MSRLGVNTPTFTAIASNNLLPKFSTFNDSFTWNGVSGGTNAVVENTIERVYYGSRSMGITFTGTSAITYDAGGTDLQITIAETGTYLIPMSLFRDTNVAVYTFDILVYVNAILFAENRVTQDLNSSNNFIDDIWNCYFQEYTFASGDVIDFQFKAQCDTIGAKLFIDGFSLELKDRVLQLPSIYTEPLPIILEAEAVLDFPSIATNSIGVLTFTMTGAVVGDYINVVAPLNVLTTGILVIQPYVSAANTVTQELHNTSGGSIDPPSGVFNYKIAK